MPETEPTLVTERSKSYLAWRIFRYLSIQGLKGLMRFDLVADSLERADNRRFWQAPVDSHAQLREPGSHELLWVVRLAALIPEDNLLSPGTAYARPGVQDKVAC